MAPWLLEVLACPACDERPPLRLEGEELICTVCGRRYPIVDGVSRLLVDRDWAEAGEEEAHGDSKS
jgi:uncharacterized protein YbaR (Trm112 family)